MALKLEWGSQDMAGNFTSFAQERRQNAAKTPGSKGPRKRGGKRAGSDMGSKGPSSRGGTRQAAGKTEVPKMAPATAVSRGGGTKPKTTSVSAKPTRVKGAGLAPVARTGATSVRDVQNTVSATSAPLKKNKAMQVGGLFGRTASGEFYLGRKKGKG